MSKTEERLARLHARAREIEKTRNRRFMYLYGALSAVIFCALVGLVTGAGGVLSFDGITYSGASMLSDSVGGYVLTAVVAFAVGVVVTMVVRSRVERRHNRRKAE